MQDWKRRFFLGLRKWLFFFGQQETEFNGVMIHTRSPQLQSPKPNSISYDIGIGDRQVLCP